MIKVKCPSCQAVVSGPERLCGKKVQCGQCKTVFQFPQLAAPAAPQAVAPQPAPRPAAPQPQAARPAAPQPAAPSQTPAKAPERKGRKPAKSKTGKKLIMLGAIGVMVLAMVGVGIFVIPKMLSGSSPDVIARYASNETFVAGRIDIQNIMQSDLYKKLGLDKLVANGMKGLPTTLKLEDFSSITILVDKPHSAYVSPSPPVIVIGVKKDVPLKEMLIPQMALNVKTLDGVDYLAMSSQATIAKTDPGTVCIISTGGVGALRKLVGELKSGQKAKLDDSLIASLDKVSGQASFFAAYLPESMKAKMAKANPVLASLKGVGVGLSIDSDMELKVAAMFADNKDAASAFKMAQGGQVAAGMMINNMVGGAKDNDVKAVLTALARTVQGVKFSQDGDQVLIDANISGNDIVLVQKNLPKLMGAMMAGTGPVAGGPATTQPAGGGPSGSPLDALMGIFGQ